MTTTDLLNLDAPYAIASVGVVCAESDEIAERHHHAAHVSTLRNLSGTPGPLLSADEIKTGPKSTLPKSSKYLEIMVSAAGFEPATHALKGHCSTT